MNSYEEKKSLNMFNPNKANANKFLSKLNNRLYFYYKICK